MKVTLDELGVALADVNMQTYVDAALLSLSDMHVANAITIDVIRASLLKMAVADRPAITWIFYGKEVHFDNDLRSHDAWNDPRSDIHGAALSDIIAAKPWKASQES